MPPQKKKSPATPATQPANSLRVVEVPGADPVEASAVGVEMEVSAAMYEQLNKMEIAPVIEFDVSGPASSSLSPGGAPVTGRSMSQEDFFTVVVTPKLTFQLLKRPEWETVQDITQSELRRGFLSRFPPALWLSSEKFSFRPALPPTHRLTEETTTLFFKIVSEEVPDEKVMLGILRELERSYEAIIRRAVTETRSEALQEQFVLQEQADEVRREQSKQIKELRKEVKSYREQMQSIQKRLFLVEQEKDQLQREQHQSKEHMQRLEKVQLEQAKEARAEKENTCTQMEALRALVEASLVSGAASLVPVATTPSPVKGNATALLQTPSPGGKKKSKTAAAELLVESPSAAEVPCVTSERGAQTEKKKHEGVQQSDLTDVSRRVDQLQQQMGNLQGWMMQGSQLLNLGSGATLPT